MAVVKKTAMAVAIEMLGGPGGVAELLELNMQQMRRLLHRPVGKWRSGYVFSIADATGIPCDLFGTGLVYPEPEPKNNPCAERPRLRRVA